MAVDYLDVLTVPKEVSPVSFREFVESEDYCNEKAMYDFWLDQPIGEESELIIDGSLGGGKSWYAAYRLVYFVYTLMLHGNNLRKFLALAENSPLYCMYFSVNLTQAKRSGFQYVFDVVDSCKWFRENCPRDKAIRSEVRFENNFSIIFASGASHQIGLNIVGFILDEANFKQGLGRGMVEDYEQVTQLYSQLIDRLLSRFASMDRACLLAILVSSASYQSSFVEERKRVVSGSRFARVITSVTYKVKPWLYPKETFKVFIGTDIIHPQIVENVKQLKLLMQAVHADRIPAMEEQYFRDVPVSLVMSFRTNISLALQNHCGVPTQIQGKFVQNMSLIQDSYYEPKFKWFGTDQVTLSSGDEVTLMDYVNTDGIVNPDLPHYFYLDLSVRQDSAGFCCVVDESALYPPMLVGGVERKRLRMAFLVEVVPPAFPYATKISKFQDFMVDVSEVVNVQGFATDQYQSTQLRQDVCDVLSLPDVRMSLDSTDEFHLLWMSGLVEGRYRMLYHPTLNREIREAEHDLRRRRVIKAAKSSDDCFQSVVGAFCLAEMAEAMSLDLPTNVTSAYKVRRLASNLGYK